jgi:hypothetical protein
MCDLNQKLDDDSLLRRSHQSAAVIGIGQRRSTRLAAQAAAD